MHPGLHIVPKLLALVTQTRNLIGMPGVNVVFECVLLLRVGR
jgi:hypothetical protein